MLQYIGELIASYAIYGKPTKEGVIWWDINQYTQKRKGKKRKEKERGECP